MKRLILYTIIVAFVALIGGGVFAFHYFQKDNDAKVLALQKQISGLHDQVATLTQENVNNALSLQEISNREAAHSKSQDELLTAAVAKLTPAVVSIVISKDVPQLQVTYQNPFGDDPFFKDFNIQVPVYQQTGTTVHQQVGAGTGFIVSSNGYILTNKHVVSDEQADYTVLMSNGAQKTAHVLYLDPTDDIAIVKIDGTGYTTAPLGDSSSLQLGQTVAAIGNALGQYNNSVSVGIISGLNRTIQPSTDSGSTETLSGIIQTDAAINPGNSGGPLLDLNGNVVGINVATVLGSNNIGFSIPINTVKKILAAVVHI